jgi:hypothetical protein
MKNGINIGLTEKKTSINVVILLICITGALLRLFHYCYNRSLWMDEIYLSSSFLHFNYAELATKVLDHDQKAPLGFLWLVRLAVDLFGRNEMAMRLVPLIAGITSLFLFSRITAYFLNPAARLLAMCVFVFSPALVYHSVEIKQYSTECLATLTALYLYIRYKDSIIWKQRILWGLSGALTLWFSYSVIFILAGIAGGLSLFDLLKKNWAPFFRNMVPFLMWMLSFGINYLLFTHRQAESDWVVYFFKTYDNFLPLPPHSLAELKWYPRNLVALMDYPLGLVWNLQHLNGSILFRLLAIPVLPVLLLAAGTVSLARSAARNFYALILPLLLTLLASGLYLYPLLERFWVFLAPVLILFIAFGFAFCQRKINIKWINTLILIMIIAGPIVQSVYFIVHPAEFYKHKKSELRESLLELSKVVAPGDVVYNYWNNYPGFDVYKVMLPLSFKAIEGRDIRKNVHSIDEYNEQMNKDFARFSGKKRVWVIYNTQFLTDIGDYADEPAWYYKGKNKPLENLQQQFRKIGRPVKKVVYRDVTVELFELAD